MIEAIQRFANAFVSGDLDSFSTHLVLLGGAITAEFAVAAGIILESPKEKGLREWLGMTLVLGGVVVSAVFTISLFVFDEGISEEQQRKIIVLASRIAPRSLTVGQVSTIASILSGKIPHLDVIRTKDPEAGIYAVDIVINLNGAGLPISILDMDEETKFLAFSEDSPLFAYCPDKTVALLIKRAFDEAGVPMGVNSDRFPTLPSQPPNSIYVSLRVAPPLGPPAWAAAPKK